jgi:hypothetical protein
MEQKSQKSSEATQEPQEASQDPNPTPGLSDPEKSVSSSKTGSEDERPWQGTVLGVLYIIGTVFAGLGIIGALLIVIAGSSALTFGLDSPIAGALAGGLGVFLLLILVALIVLMIFITKGFFRGAQWAVIVALIFSILNLLNGLGEQNLIAIAVSGFMIYLEVACLQHPFYKSKKS